MSKKTDEKSIPTDTFTKMVSQINDIDASWEAPAQIDPIQREVRLRFTFDTGNVPITADIFKMTFDPVTDDLFDALDLYRSLYLQKAGNTWSADQFQSVITKAMVKLSVYTARYEDYCKDVDIPEVYRLLGLILEACHNYPNALVVTGQMLKDEGEI